MEEIYQNPMDNVKNNGNHNGILKIKNKNFWKIKNKKLHLLTE